MGCQPVIGMMHHVPVFAVGLIGDSALVVLYLKPASMLSKTDAPLGINALCFCKQLIQLQLHGMTCYRIDEDEPVSIAKILSNQ
jgi:hypothetical protein